jgi:hypothetical protein
MTVPPSAHPRARDVGDQRAAVVCEPCDVRLAVQVRVRSAAERRVARLGLRQRSHRLGERGHAGAIGPEGPRRGVNELLEKSGEVVSGTLHIANHVVPKREHAARFALEGPCCINRALVYQPQRFAGGGHIEERCSIWSEHDTAADEPLLGGRNACFLEQQRLEGMHGRMRRHQYHFCGAVLCVLWGTTVHIHFHAAGICCHARNRGRGGLDRLEPCPLLSKSASSELPLPQFLNSQDPRSDDAPVMNGNCCGLWDTVASMKAPALAIAVILRAEILDTHLDTHLDTLRLL